MATKACIGCGRELKVNFGGTPKDGLEILGHDVICNDCAQRAGIPLGMRGAFVAATYTREKFFEKYGKADSIRPAVKENKKSKKEKQKNSLGDVFKSTLDDMQESAASVFLEENRKLQEKGEVEEIKMTCSACGHIHFYDTSDFSESAAHTMLAAINPGSLQGTVELAAAGKIDKCPQCGSRAITFEKVVNKINA